MRIGVLGNVILTDGDSNFVPSAPKARQLLAFLMLNANEMVRASDCVEELWGPRSPKSAMSTLQTYILHIRRMLRTGQGDAGMLVTRNPGYELALHGAHFDRVEFEELVRRGRQAAAAAQDACASALFAEALRLWRGPVLADVPIGPHSSPHVVELEETRTYAQEQRIEADLRLGRHSALLDDLGILTSQHPTHENVHAQFMVALYRSGRRTQALRVFHALSSELADTLGIEPAPRMRRLRDAIVTRDPALDLVPH
jgi:SARP family transcriptional regulator, regulator of embCAB operon